MQTESNVYAFFIGGPLDGTRHRYPGTPFYKLPAPRAVRTLNGDGQTPLPVSGAVTYRLETLRVGENDYPVYVLESMSLADAMRSLTVAHDKHKTAPDTCPLCYRGREKL